ncbi:membrane protein FAM174 isoform X2 [Lepisosteus oculatus]|uniref:Transmembrane protein 157 n=2 Tax=Lepisosteus oculatus TaxID=7918 RepID=W5MRN7_LEPOC|nr:PREDICTED: membrane protein FAM174A isoform X2 [Lepisosteus oculatus]
MGPEKTRVFRASLFVCILLPVLLPPVATVGPYKAPSTKIQVGISQNTGNASSGNTKMNTHTGSVGVREGKNNSTGDFQSTSRTVAAELAANDSRPMSIQRALYVLVAVSALVIVYFVIRTVKMKKNRKTRRYGVLDTNLAMEMTPLEQDEDEDDDTTLFDARISRR